jgi:pimeloyl-ACP methyl ester carboxylesterase
LSRRALLLALAMVGLAGCTAGKPVRVPADSPLASQCDTVPTDAKRVTLTMSDGTRLGAAILGSQSASTGLIFATGASQTLCDWLTVMSELATDTSVRIVIPDRRGTGSSEGKPQVSRYVGDLIEVSDWLAKNGVERLIIAGTSYGAPIAAATALKIQSLHGLCAFIAISPLRAISEQSGKVEIPSRRLRSTAVWAVTEDGNPVIESNARWLFQELRASSKGRFLLVPTNDHSLALIQSHPEARRLIGEAVASCNE